MFRFVFALAVLLGVVVHSQAGMAQNLTQYQIQLEKVEACFDATCTNTFVLAESPRQFDIAGGAGQNAPVGSFSEVVRPTVGDTFTHIAVTVSRTVQVTGTAFNNAACNTQAGVNGAIGASAAGGAGAAGSASLVIPSNAVIGVDLESNPGSLSFAQSLNWVGGNQNTAPSARVVYALATPYTCTGEPPEINVTFNTNAAIQDIGGCNLIPRDPDVSVTFN